MIVEPDRLPLAIVEHQGFGWIDVIVRGKASHGSAPDAGVDAIVHMAEVVQRLHRLDREVFQTDPDPMNRRTVFHTGTRGRDEREPLRAAGHETLLEAMDAASVDELGTPMEQSGLNAWADSGLARRFLGLGWEPRAVPAFPGLRFTFGRRRVPTRCRR